MEDSRAKFRKELRKISLTLSCISVVRHGHTCTIGHKVATMSMVENTLKMLNGKLVIWYHLEDCGSIKKHGRSQISQECAKDITNNESFSHISPQAYARTMIQVATRRIYKM